MTKFLIQEGCLTGSEWRPSPNYNQRPENLEISLLVVHNISLPPGEFDTGCIGRFFCNELSTDEHPYFEEIEGMEVSAHLLVERSGKVTQFVNFNDRAWHAGVSQFLQQENCNDFSLGIELEGTDDVPYTKEQYQMLAEISCQLMQAYPQLTAERIVGHSDIAPGRKTDPGPAFDWDYFRSLL